MDQYTLGPRTIQALRRNDQALRTAPISRLAPRGTIMQPNMHTMRAEAGIGVVYEEEGILPCTLDPIAYGVGKIQFLVIQEDGLLEAVGPMEYAYNPFPHFLPLTSICEVVRDWRTGRWLIVNHDMTARTIYFIVNNNFGYADASFSAEISQAFDGFNPVGRIWDGSGSGDIINPLVAGGHFFKGTAGMYGFAALRDEDADVENAPEYVCFQLQCEPVPAAS